MFENSISHFPIVGIVTAKSDEAKFGERTKSRQQFELQMVTAPAVPDFSSSKVLITQ